MMDSRPENATVPTYEDIVRYADSQKLLGRFDSRKFYDYYKKSGFLFHGTLIDWKGKMHSWVEREKRPFPITTAEKEILNPYRVNREEIKTWGRASLNELKQRVDMI